MGYGLFKKPLPIGKPTSSLAPAIALCPPFSHPYRGKWGLGDREGGRTGFLCEKAASTFQKKSGNDHVHISMAWQTQ